MVKKTDRVWLISGCSTGLGRALAQFVLEQGDRAAVTARDRASILDLVERHGNRAGALELDVTKPDQVRDVVRKVHDAFGRVDVLVNNAGYGYLAAVEEGEDDEVRAMFEANTFGLFALTRAVLPLMRAQRSGHFVNITSVGGLVGNPGSGYYAASKFAVEGFSEALSKEVAPLGIKVTAVEPGPFRTDWAGRSLKQSKLWIEDYASTSGRRREEVPGYSGKQAGDPARAAKAIFSVVGSTTPPLHLVLGGQGLGVVRRKLDSLRSDLDANEALSLSADFPTEGKG